MSKVHIINCACVWIAKGKAWLTRQTWYRRAKNERPHGSACILASKVQGHLWHTTYTEISLRNHTTHYFLTYVLIIIPRHVLYNFFAVCVNNGQYPPPRNPPHIWSDSVDIFFLFHFQFSYKLNMLFFLFHSCFVFTLLLVFCGVVLTVKMKNWCSIYYAYTIHYTCI